jgi:hypothetical protein
MAAASSFCYVVAIKAHSNDITLAKVLARSLDYQETFRHE